ncbi:hypothetical protein GGF46_003083 [Coemansia sp. RSA 552]|nr:hypothetical protein GGF46_003083 [Coemansia sp. RSA 552]
MSLTYFSQSYYGGMYYGTWTDGKDVIVKTTLAFHGKSLAALFHEVNIYRCLQKLQGDIIPLYYDYGYASLNGSRVAVLVIERIPGDVVPMSDEMDLRPELANLTPSAPLKIRGHMVDCTSEYCAVAYSLDRALAVGGVFENDIWHIFSAKSELAKEVRHLRLLPTSQQLESEPYALEKATVDNAAVMVNVRELGQEMELTADIISFFGPRLDFLISLVAPDIHDIQYMLGSPTSGPDAYYMARKLTSLGTDIDAILEVKCRFSKRPCVSHPADDQIAANFAANQDYLNSMFGDNRNTSHGLNVLHALTQVTHYITTNSKSYGHAFIFSADGIIYVRRYKDGRIYTSELIPYNSTRPYPLVFLASAILEGIDGRQSVEVPINYDNAWEYTANDGQDNRN